MYKDLMREAKKEYDEWCNGTIVIWYGNKKVVGPATTLRKYPAKNKVPCTKCGKKSYLRQLCKTHYQAWWLNNTEKGIETRRRIGRRKFQKVKKDPIRYAKLKARSNENNKKWKLRNGIQRTVQKDTKMDSK